MNNKLLTIEELAEFFRVAVSTLYQWTETGKIPHIKCGRLLRYDLDAVLEHLKNSNPGIGGKK